MPNRYSIPLELTDDGFSVVSTEPLTIDQANLLGSATHSFNQITNRNAWRSEIDEVLSSQLARKPKKDPSILKGKNKVIFLRNIDYVKQREEVEERLIEILDTAEKNILKVLTRKEFVLVQGVLLSDIAHYTDYDNYEDRIREFLFMYCFYYRQIDMSRLDTKKHKIPKEHVDRFQSIMLAFLDKIVDLDTRGNNVITILHEMRDKLKQIEIYEYPY